MAKTNFEMIARVRDRIAEVGNEHCDMDSWAHGEVSGSGEPACGTTACVAGWTMAVALGRWNGEWLEGQPEPAELLGIPDPTGDDPSLFYKALWPAEYRHIAVAEGDAKGMLAILDDILDRKIDPNTLEPIASPSGE